MKKISLTLEQHHQVLYDIVYAIDDFCKKYNIEFFLVYGTLLGAVRHNGIIPWDDDIDIGMMRSTYNRFVELFKENTPEGYIIYECNLNTFYKYPFVKIGKKNTLLYESNDRLEGHSLCINIDIFPFDGLKGDNIEDAKIDYDKKNNRVSSLVNAWIGNPTTRFVGWKSKIIYALFHFTPIVNYRLNHAYEGVKEISVEKAKFCANILWTCYGNKEAMPVEWFRSFKTCKFGERELPIPIGTHEILTQLYGDYMIPYVRDGHFEGTSYVLE